MPLCELATLYVEKLGGAQKYARKYAAILQVWCTAVTEIAAMDGTIIKQKVLMKLVAGLLGVPVSQRPDVLRTIENIGLDSKMPKAVWRTLKSGAASAVRPLHNFESRCEAEAVAGRPNFAELDEEEVAAYLRRVQDEDE